MRADAGGAGPADGGWRAGDRRWLAGVFLLALAARALFLWEIRDAPGAGLLFVDSRGYDAWARRLAAGDWIGSGVFYQAPLYPYFLGAVYALFGTALATVRAVQAALGSLSCVLLALAAARFAGRRAGLLAGALLALSPAAVFSDALVQKSVLDVLCLCAFLLALARALAAPSPPRWLAAGAALAALTLTRENAAVFFPVLAACVLIGAGGGAPPPRRLAGLAGALLGAALVLGPVAVRNRVAGGEFFPTTSQLGTNLYIGNNPAATGVYVPLRYGREEPAEEQQDARELAEAGAGRPLTPSGVSAYWRDRALEFAREQPGAWLRLMGRKALLTLNATEVPDAYDQYTFGDWSALLRWLDRLANFGVLLALAAAGIVLSWGRRRALWPLHALIAAYAGSVALFYVFSRYRLPLVPLLAPFAALALTEGAALARARRWRALALPAAAAALAALVALAPLTDRRRCRATMLTNIAHRLIFEEGRSAEAVPHLLEVVRLLPDFALGHYHLGAAYARTGRPAEARAALERAAALLPAHPQTWLELGRIERSRRRPADAAALLERGLRHDPRDRALLLELGKALTEAGRLREAAAAFERARLLYPGDVEVLANAGQALVDLGEHREGAARLEEAIRARGSTWGAAELYLGLALAGQGRAAEAEPHLRAALRAGADPARAARALEGLGRARAGAAPPPGRP